MIAEYLTIKAPTRMCAQIWIRVPMRAPHAVSFWTKPSTSPSCTQNSESTSSTSLPSWSSVVSGSGAKRSRNELTPKLSNGFGSECTPEAAASSGGSALAAAPGSASGSGPAAGAAAAGDSTTSASESAWQSSWPASDSAGAMEADVDVEDGELVGAEAEDGAEYDAAWRAWSTFHALTGFQRDVALALELTADLPSDEQLQRWLAEPIRALLVPVSLFVMNPKSSSSTLSLRHQSFLYSALRIGSLFTSHCSLIVPIIYHTNVYSIPFTLFI